MARYFRSSLFLLWLAALICYLRSSNAIPIGSNSVPKEAGSTSEEIAPRQAKALNFPNLFFVPPNPLPLNPYPAIGLRKKQDSISDEKLQGRIFFTTDEKPLNRIANTISSWRVDIGPDLRPAQIIDGGLRDIAQAIRNN